MSILFDSRLVIRIGVKNIPISNDDRPFHSAHIRSHHNIDKVLLIDGVACVKHKMTEAGAQTDILL